MSRPAIQLQSTERGSTVAEMLVALAIASTIAVAAIGALRSASDHHASQASTLDNHYDASRSMNQLLVDIRGSVFAPELSTQASLSNSLPLIVPTEAGGTEFVEWSLDSFGLTRTASPLSPLDPQPGWTTTAIVEHPNTATFEYLNARGEELDLMLGSETLRACTVAITIRLHLSTDEQSTSTSHNSGASFRLNNGGQSC